jgi:hypothetical protein
LKIRNGGCGFCVILRIWKSGSRAMSERIVALKSDRLCLMYVRTHGLSPCQIICIGMNGCQALCAAGPLLLPPMSPIHGS